MKKILICLCLVISGTSDAVAQVEENIEQVGDYFISGSYNHIYLDAETNNLYCTNGYGLAIIDVDDPYSMQLISVVSTPNGSNGVVLNRGYAYVTDGSLNIFSVRDIENPITVNRIDFELSVHKVNVYEDHLYLGAGYRHMYVLSLEDPTSPKLISTYEDVGMGSDIVIHDSLLFTGGSGVSYIWSLEDPAHPNQIGTVEIHNRFVIHGVTISGDYAYYARNQSGFIIVSIEDPTNPSIIEYRNIGSSTYSISSNSDILAVGSNDGLYLYSLDDPEDPEEISLIEKEYRGTAYSVLFDEESSLMYVANGRQGVNSYLIDNPDEPELLDYYKNPIRLLDVAVDNDLVAVGFDGAYGVLSMEDPENYIAAVYEQGEADEHFFVAISGELLFTASDLLQISIVEDPNDIELIYEYDIPGYATGITVAGDFLYVTTFYNDIGDNATGILHIFDISNLEDVERLSRLPFRWIANFEKSLLQFENDRIYLMNSGIIEAIDVSDPSNPELLARLAAGVDFVVDNDTLYVVNREELIIISVTDPNEAELISQIEIDGSSIYSIDKSGEHVLLSFGSPDHEGIKVLNIADPENPFVVGSYNTPGHAYSVSLKYNLAFVADNYCLGIYDLSEALSVPIVIEHSPSSFHLSSAYPNPFNSTALFSYGIPSPSQVSLKLYNLTGQNVKTLFEGYKRAGDYTNTLNASGLTTGLYFVRLEASNMSITQKVLLIN